MALDYLMSFDAIGTGCLISVSGGNATCPANDGGGIALAGSVGPHGAVRLTRQTRLLPPEVTGSYSSTCIWRGGAAATLQTGSSLVSCRG